MSFRQIHFITNNEIYKLSAITVAIFKYIVNNLISHKYQIVVTITYIKNNIVSIKKLNNIIKLEKLQRHGFNSFI